MQDESTQKQGDSPQGTSPAEAGTPAQADRTYSEQEVQKLISDEKSRSGRVEKKLTTQLADAQAKAQSLQDELESTTGRLDEVEMQIRQSKLDRSNPDSVSLFQEREALLNEKRTLERDKRAFQAEKVRIEEQRKSLMAERIKGIADRYGVSIDDLEALGTDNMEVLERYAKAVGKPETPETKPGFKPDSNLGAGSPGALTAETGEKLNDEQYIRERQKQIMSSK